MGESREHAFLGWHGWGLEHPSAWELNRVKGNRSTGYLALDDGDQVRLEVSWRPVKSRITVEAIADRQVKMLETAARRRKIDLEMKRRRRIGRVKGFEYEAFTWRADVSACELVGRCKACSRVVLVRVVGDPDRPPTDEARRVFSSLACYCAGDVERWGTFGLDVKVPTRFDLEHSSLRAGLCELTFTDRRVELHVGRAALGRVMLEKQKMTAWYETTARTLLKPFDVTWVEEPFRGHIGHAGTGELRANRRLLGFFRADRAFSVHCFYCDVSDKILTVSAEGPGDVRDVVETVREGLVCH